MKTTITTVSGIEVDLLNPTFDMINIDDIAHALAMQVRYNGHVRQFYSVAQHSVLASHMVEDKYMLTTLMHDAAEAYLGDVVSPLKKLLPYYSSIEATFEKIIAQKFGLIYPFPEETKTADRVMLYSEQLWREGILDFVAPLDPEAAKREFLIQFNQLATQ